MLVADFCETYPAKDEIELANENPDDEESLLEKETELREKSLFSKLTKSIIGVIVVVGKSILVW